MAQTQRFGLTHFGSEAEGSLFDDGGKYTGRDRQLIDRLLAAFEVHDHSGGSRVADPDFTPTLNLATTGGALPSGTTLHYRVSFVDGWGLETAASDEVSVATPGAVEAPAPPAVEAKAGGTLAPGLYWYAITVLSAGNETQLSSPQVITISDWNSVAVSSFEPLPVGADEVSIWRQGPLESGFTRLVTIPVPANLIEYFLDDGSIAADPCACDPTNLPPDENFTNATNSVSITIPNAEVFGSTGVKRWRIYRSETSGLYPASSLVAEVVETTVEGGVDLVNVYVDTGESIGTGQPLEVSQTLQGSAELSGAGDGGGGGVFLLVPPGGGDVWKLLATADGALETRSTGLSTSVEEGVALTAEDGAVWYVTVDAADGTLVTTTNPVPVDAPVYAYGSGPDIPTGDPTVTWRLGVDVMGALFTEGAPVPGTELMSLRPVTFEPDAPAVGGVLYLFGGELRWKDAAGTVTALASPAP